MALKEIIRILRPGGRGLIYAWAKEQERNAMPSSYLKKSKSKSVSKSQPKPSSQFDLPVHENRTDFLHSDLLVPWKRKGEEPKTFHRFYHVFQEKELEDLVRRADGTIEIEKTYYDQGNWCVILRKPMQCTMQFDQ